MNLRLKVNQHRSSDNEYSGFSMCRGDKKKIGVSRTKMWFESLELCPNHYGKDGWELIKMGSGEIGHRLQEKWFLFKRQI